MKLKDPTIVNIYCNSLVKINHYLLNNDGLIGSSVVILFQLWLLLS